MSVLPYFASEKLLAGFAGQPPFKGCGLSADWAATALATDNESAMVRGRPKGRAHRTADLKRGWRAFTRVADSNGIPDTDDAVRIHRAMFPDLPDPTQFRTRDFGDVIAKLDAGFAVSIALRLAALPASSPLRRRTSADHQVTIYRRLGDKVRCIDPMHDHSDRYVGEMVPLAHVKDAARAIEDGLILTWLFPIGGWTQAALLRQRLNARHEDATRELLAGHRAKVRELEQRIRDLEEAGPCDDEVDAALARFEEAAVDAIRSLPRP